MRLSNVDTGELARFKEKLICRFILAVDMVGVVSRSLCHILLKKL